MLWCCLSLSLCNLLLNGIWFWLGCTFIVRLVFTNPGPPSFKVVNSFLDAALPPTIKKPHFFSSDESEGEEDHKKKFKIKIKPLPSDRVASVPSVDELKASIGNIALSPSPMVSTSDATVLSLLAFLYSRMCWGGSNVHMWISSESLSFFPRQDAAFSPQYFSFISLVCFRQGWSHSFWKWNFYAAIELVCLNGQ